VGPVYAQEGKAIGRLIMHDREQEAYLWSLLGGTGLWPRWYLYAFATLYREENIREYNAQKAIKHSRRKRKKESRLKCEEKQQEAFEKAS